MKNQSFPPSHPSFSPEPDQGLWTEENTRRLLQAAVPAPEPDPTFLLRLERRMESLAEFQPIRQYRHRLALGLRWVAIVYLLLLGASAWIGYDIRLNIAAVTPTAVTTYRTTGNSHQ